MLPSSHKSKRLYFCSLIWGLVGAVANVTMHRGDMSTTCRPVSQCSQPNIIKHDASIALGRPNSTQGWNCLFIISIILGLWKMALAICGEIEEVIFLLKCVLMMCCLMECLGPAFQNAGNSALFFVFHFYAWWKWWMKDLIVRRPCLGTPEPHDLLKSAMRKVYRLTGVLLFCTAKWKIKPLNACSRYQLTIWIMYLQLEKESVWLSDSFHFCSCLHWKHENKLLWLLNKFGSCT